MTIWSDRVFVIAEAGVNHNGSIQLAKELIDAAASAGVDAVKFQTFSADALVSKDAVAAEYQKQNIGSEEITQYQMLKSLELSNEQQIELKAYSEDKGILWFSTAFDSTSLDFLQSLDSPLWKIPSGEITNFPYLRRIGSLGKPVILSTGMCSLGEVEWAVNVLSEAGVSKEMLCILHCNTEYPTPWSDVNLKAMPMLGRAFGTSYGYSDHTKGIEVPIAAVALGAKVIEKHFTLDRTMPGPDHAASLEPDELAAMVKAIRHIELSLGDGIKRMTLSESANSSVARKSIVAARPIRKGEVFRDELLSAKRPGTGISHMEWPRLIGRVASRDYSEGEQITW